ncbi:MAG: vWA domain-containing protein [Planctomycetota bacterium]
MKRFLAVALALAAAIPARAEEKVKLGEVDVVFCIDRSGSMDQVIDTAKQKIWGIVNDIAKVRPTPVLRIGLIGYGSGNTDFRFFDLTDDLDTVYSNLMTFRTDMGGDEWVGAVIQKATKEMKWSKNKEALRMIFAVGNETAMQGREDLLYPKTVPEAIKADIVVNAIYCGQPNADEERTWREVAKLADGSYTVIDITGGAITIATPMDEEMSKLNEALNKTYIAYGHKGKDGLRQQEEQDRNSSDNGGASNGAQRAEAKSSGVYNNSSWDMVDACKGKDFKIEDVKDEDLPENMRKMTLDEKKAYIATMKAEREKIQKEVQAKAVERQKYIDAEIKSKGLTQDKAFDEAVRKMVREQAEKKGFEVGKE